MRKKYFTLFLCLVVLISTFVPMTAKADSIPFFQGDGTKVLRVNDLSAGPTFVRNDSFTGLHWLGTYRYPTIYQGQKVRSAETADNSTFSGDTNPKATRALHSQPYYHLVPYPSYNTARNMIEPYKVTSSLVKNVYGGNPDYVLNDCPQYDIRQSITNTSYGKYYWIRDIAFFSGGIAENTDGTFDGINPTRLYYIRTSWPDITDFQASSSNGYKVGGAVSLNFKGYEYTSFDRNSMKWSLNVTKNGSNVSSNSGSMSSSKGQLNSSKPNEIEAGAFKSSTSWTPSSEGTYTVTLKVEDAVKRYATKSITVTIGKNGGTDPITPPDSGGGGGSCNVPDIIGGNLRYNYELDLATIQIEGETVEKGTSTTTPVTVYRADYSANRERVRQEINADLNRAKSEKAQLESELRSLESQLASLQSSLASAESALATCKATPPKCTTDKKGHKTCSPPPSCSGQESAVSSYKSKIEAKKAEIEKKKCDIQRKQAEIRGFEKELTDLTALENQYRVVSTNVALEFNGIQVGNIPISLVEGQSTTLNFNWILPSDGTVRAEINPDHNVGIDETTYSNNAMSTPIYIATHATAPCSLPGGTSSINGIVRTVTTMSGTQFLREYVTGKIVNQSRTEMRAGYGFSYDVQTTYINEDPKSHAYGIQKTESYFPTLVNFLPYKKGAEGYIVNMDLMKNQATNPPRNETKIWSLPQVYVEEYSGNVFDEKYQQNVNHNPAEKILDGGRKWYSPFEQPDGPYNFSVRGFDAGVNKLNLCMQGTVKVEGSFIGDEKGHDDFVYRSINPNKPFPSGTGWNWIGKQSIIDKLTSWWNEWKYPDPKDTPSGWHMDKMTLTPDEIQSIKEYNKTHSLKDMEMNDGFSTGY